MLSGVASGFSIFLEQIMICCRKNSQWFENDIIHLPSNHHQDINCPLSAEDLGWLQKQEDAEQKNMEKKYEKRLS